MDAIPTVSDIGSPTSAHRTLTIGHPVSALTRHANDDLPTLSAPSMMRIIDFVVMLSDLPLIFVPLTTLADKHMEICQGRRNIGPLGRSKSAPLEVIGRRKCPCQLFKGYVTQTGWQQTKLKPR